MSAPLVHLHGVRHRLGTRFVLDVAELSLGPGITVLRGPNGCGKSTLLRLLATVAAPDDGTITVAGRPLDREPDLVAVRRTLGYLPQHESTPSRMRAFDHVDVVAVMREIAPDTRGRRALVHRALATVGMVSLARERCGALSGGQRRRVALAAALAGAPSLLVLDEPDTSLDRDQLDALAAELRSRAPHATIVVATHDAGWAAALQPARTVELRDGRPVIG